MKIKKTAYLSALFLASLSAAQAQPPPPLPHGPSTTFPPATTQVRLHPPVTAQPPHWGWAIPPTQALSPPRREALQVTPTVGNLMPPGAATAGTRAPPSARKAPSLRPARLVITKFRFPLTFMPPPMRNPLYRSNTRRETPSGITPILPRLAPGRSSPPTRLARMAWWSAPMSHWQAAGTTRSPSI